MDILVIRVYFLDLKIMKEDKDLIPEEAKNFLTNDA